MRLASANIETTVTVVKQDNAMKCSTQETCKTAKITLSPSRNSHQSNTLAPIASTGRRYSYNGRATIQQPSPEGIPNYEFADANRIFENISLVTTSSHMATGKWFPKHISDLDYCSQNVIMFGPGPDGLHADHPSFTDEEYRKRRMEFFEIARDYKYGQPLPRIEYNETEKKTWKAIYQRLKILHKKYACKEFLQNFELLEKYCGYSEDNIPQLDDVSRFLKARSGFTLRPVGGYQAPRDFLAGLAFRVFNCTQYVRHHKFPFYTPEPDMVHEFLGHMAMFADPRFAQFSEEIGLASLGASEEECREIARLYFFTIEFGLSLEDAEFEPTKKNLKVYGAGLLSCVDELEFAVSDKSKVHRFEPDFVVKTVPSVTTFQECYYFTRNLEEALIKLRIYTATMKRPFSVLYNAHTNTIDLINSRESLQLASEAMRFNVEQISAAIRHNIS
ncbi:unnamed protein product [Anisakis simplex]|uniref:BH4_AAA_HYDROXYL_2 domain-containing protein n=1 Tax=Anisakis simplex TaxID=6269 RepID=A0A0M3K758_ANISI|nr:unnamed protein product [Anisakis simplex]